jgi:hypothetical protein
MMGQAVMYRAGLGAVAMVIACASSACVVETNTPPPRGVVVGGPPPEPRAEVAPAAPRAGAVWVRGYWHWSGMQYVWIPGHWDDPPRGQAWHAPQYSFRDGTYFYEAGTWR